MKEFLDLYGVFMNNQIDIYSNKHLLYNNMNISFNKTNDINAKMFILEKMITLYPEDYELYYRAGQLFKGLSKRRNCFGINFVSQLSLIIQIIFLIYAIYC